MKRARFGNYELLRRLGAGGMAEVYLARQMGAGAFHKHGFHKDIALKCIQPDLSSEPEAMLRFVAEAKLAALLTHPNIVQVYDLGVVERRYFIAMEYVPGTTLADLRDRLWRAGRAFHTTEAIAVIVAVLDALGYAHQKRDDTGRPLDIVHRDVSPENILLSRDGHVKLADFGLAKAVTSVTQTRTGELRGKLAYMAPEQAAGRAIDRRADLFAVGLIAYELLAGKICYDATTDSAVLQLALAARIPELTTINPAIPPELSRILARALARSADDRFQSAQELARALRSCVDVTRADLAALIAPPAQRRTSLRLALALGLIGLAAVMARVVTRAEPPPTLAPIALPGSAPTESDPTLVMRPEEPGFLAVNALPWAEIWVDGKHVGKTPMAHLQLAPGAHRLRLVCPLLKMERSVDVLIASRKHARKLFNFETGTVE